MAELVSAPLFQALWDKWVSGRAGARNATPRALAKSFRDVCSKEAKARAEALTKWQRDAAGPVGPTGPQPPTPFKVPDEGTILGWIGARSPTAVSKGLQPSVLWFFRNDLDEAAAKQLQAAWDQDNKRRTRGGAQPLPKSGHAASPPAAKNIWKPDPSFEPESGEADLVRFNVLPCDQPALRVHLSHGPWSTPLEATTDGLPAAQATLRLKKVTLVPAVKGATPVPGSIFQEPPWHYGTAWTREFDPLGNGLLLDGQTLVRYQVTGSAVSIRLSVCCEFNDLDAKIANAPPDATAMDLRVAERALQVLNPKEKRTLYVLAEGALLPPGRKK